MSSFIPNWQDVVRDRRPRLQTMFMRLLPHLRPFSSRIAVVALCGIAAAAADLLSIGLLFPLLQTVVGQGELKLPFLDMNLPIVLWLAAMPVDERILMLLGAMVVVQFVRESIVYLNSVIVARTHAAVACAFRLEVFDRILSMPLTALQSVPMAYYYSILNSLSQQGADVAIVAVRMIAPIVSAITMGVVLALLSVELTLLAAATVIGVAFTISFIVGRQQRVFAKLGDLGAILNHRTYELFAAIKTVRLFNREDLMRARQIEISTQYWGTHAKSQYWAQAIGPVSQILTVTAAASIFAVGTVLLSKNDAGWIELIILYFYGMMRLTAPASQLNALRSEFAARAPGADLIAEFLATTTKPSQHSGRRPVRGAIRFERVSFRYDGAATDALSDVDLEIPEHKVVGIVGPSGAGKSTLIDLLLGLRRPTGGRLVFGGVDAATLDEAAIRSHVALVSQDTFLFADTIRENIRFGRPVATDAEVEDAVRRANLTEFVEELPDGIDTWVGERGIRLSGGQAQRVSIARAILANPAILVLDEATSAQDAESESAIRASIRGLAGERTVVVIAHRLAAVRDADAIVVLDGGRIVERGTHKELAAGGGLYARFVNLQDLKS